MEISQQIGETFVTSLRMSSRCLRATRNGAALETLYMGALEGQGEGPTTI